MTKLAAQKQLSVTEPLDLRLLPDEGLRYEEALAPPWLDEQLADYAEDSTGVHAIAEGRAALDVEPLAPVASRPPIRVRGDVSAKVAMTCVRCLLPVEQELAAHVDLTLFAIEQAREEPEQREDRDEDEGLDPHQLDEGTYEGNALDIPGLVREALILEIAMNPRCADEAACTDRTDALIKEANRESEAVTGDRWAALRRLRDGSSGQGNQS